MNAKNNRLSVGLIGLGAMGNGMAQSLRRAGHMPHVFDVRTEVAEAFAKDGGNACKSLAELAAACDVVVSVVVNAAQTESVLFDKDGCAASMKQGSVFIMCSTVDPNWSVALEARLATLGILYIDAPISGGAAKAASGQMTMMTAGKPEAYAIADNVLSAMASTLPLALWWHSTMASAAVRYQFASVGVEPSKAFSTSGRALMSEAASAFQTLAASAFPFPSLPTARVGA